MNNEITDGTKNDIMNRTVHAKKLQMFQRFLKVYDKGLWNYLKKDHSYLFICQNKQTGRVFQVFDKTPEILADKQKYESEIANKLKER